MNLDAGKVTPLHTHPDADESLYVLRGEIVVHVDGREHRVGPGGFAMAPRGVPHAFLVSDGPASVLCLHTPGCCEAFYRDASEPLGADDPGSGGVDFARVQESAARNGGIEILGPPPFAPR
jgi:quercetin dioxygenase-like cupin family protein